jgi:hypothetical protein
MLSSVVWSVVIDVSRECNTIETSVTTYQPTRRNLPEDLNLHDNNLSCVHFLKNNAAECGLFLSKVW